MLTQHLSDGSVLQGVAYRYTIKKVLGQGAFGITYLATTEVEGPLGKLPVNVALKEFFAKDLNGRAEDGSVREVSSDSIARRYGRAFQRESLNLSHMKHPGIIRVLEAFEANNTYYYAMEYVDGGSLDAYILAKGGLPEKEALERIREIGSALSYMHEQKMLHLDLKPKNIMRRSDGSMVLIDFGLSKQYDSSGEPESSSSIGLGTPGYAPLEQANSTSGKEFAVTLDIYALGATYYKMLTGKSPADASIILNDGFPKEELQKANVSEKSIAAIERAMSPQKKNRPQSVKAFLSLLGDDKSGVSPVPDGDEETRVNSGERRSSESVSSSSPKRNSHLVLWIALFSFIGIGVLAVLLLTTGTNLLSSNEVASQEPASSSDSTGISSVSATVQTGTLKIGSVPTGAILWLDGKNTGKSTPLTVENLSAGIHKVVLKLDGYEDGIKEVDVVSAQYGECSITLKQKVSSVSSSVVQTGTLKVSSTPSGANIWLDGKNTGKTTPEILEEIAAGSHKIVLKYEGYKDGVKQISVSSGKRSECTVTLTKIPEPAKPSMPQNYTETAFGINMKMVYVAGGSFTMGATSEQGSDAESDEKPAHQVTLSGYYIGAFEVTQGQWEKVMGNNPSSFKKGDYYPVENISWEDAQSFCRELSHRTGKKYVLPTEAQWEYAARGGSKKEGAKYSGGDAIDAVAWYRDNSGSSTHTVGTKRPNGLGIYDMSGSVFEWCSDWYSSDYYSNFPSMNPTGPSSGYSRVLRGGSWIGSAASCRVSERFSISPSSCNNIIGFRVVCLP